MKTRPGEANQDIGLTLLEVIISLMITGVVVGMTLNLYLNQYRLLKDVMEAAENRYSLMRAGQVLSAAISTADKVEWTGKKLQISYEKSGQRYKDSFYLADKDYDGTIDLYREHLSVPNPVASRLLAMTVSESHKGLWTISLGAGNGSSVMHWQRKVRQRVWLE